MKTKIYLLLVLAVLAAASVGNAQNLIAVQHGGTNTFYSTLDSAIAMANSGDNIYLPGGSFTITNPIDKEVHIYGTGHNPDSTLATHQTTIQGNIVLITGASNSSFTGLMNSNFWCGTNASNEDVDNIKITRCNGSIYLSGYSTNWLVTECVLGNIQGNSYASVYAQSNSFFNNFINSEASNLGPNNIFRNNIFLSDYGVLDGDTSCIFENNIFYGGFVVTYYQHPPNLYYCTFNNNLFSQSYWNSNINGNCTGCFIYNNTDGQAQSSFFVGGTPYTNSFYYGFDYHLQSS